MKSTKDEEKTKKLLDNINNELDELKKLVEYLSSVNGCNYKIKLENNKIVIELERIEYFI